MARALSVLYQFPDHELSLTDLARQINVSPGALHSDIDRLVQAGMVIDRVDGRSRKLRCNQDHPAATALAKLLLVTVAADLVVGLEFSTVAGVEELGIFGSWAASQFGVANGFPNDIDVLVVGSPNRKDVYAAADRVAGQLNLQVNPTIISADQWRGNIDGFVETIRSSPFISIIR